MKILLIPVNGGPSVEIDRDLTLVGRNESCDLRLDHKTVSKIHCVIVRNDGMLLMRDLGSTNGCRINGQRMKRGALLPNDILSVAVFEYRVHLSPDAADAGMDDDGPGDNTEVIHMDDLKRVSKAKRRETDVALAPLESSRPVTDGLGDLPDADD